MVGFKHLLSEHAPCRSDQRPDLTTRFGIAPDLLATYHRPTPYRDLFIGRRGNGVRKMSDMNKIGVPLDFSTSLREIRNNRRGKHEWDTGCVSGDFLSLFFFFSCAEWIRRGFCSVVAMALCAWSPCPAKLS